MLPCSKSVFHFPSSATKLHFFLGVFFHFIIGADRAKIRIHATAGMSKRLDSCTPKKKNSNSINPAQRFSYHVPEPIFVMCNSHMPKQPAAIRGIVQNSHAITTVIRPSIPLNTVVITASSRFLLSVPLPSFFLKLLCHPFDKLSEAGTVFSDILPRPAAVRPQLPPPLRRPSRNDGYLCGKLFHVLKSFNSVHQEHINVQKDQVDLLILQDVQGSYSRIRQQ